MNREDEILATLTRIQAAQDALLEEYRRVAGESLALQKRALENQERAVAQQAEAVATQRQHAKIYKGVVIAGGFLIGLVAFVLVRLFPYL